MKSSEQSDAITRAICSGGTHFDQSDFGIDSRLAGVSITLGRIALARTPSPWYSACSERTKARIPAFAVM